MTTSSHESAPARTDGPAPDLGWSLAVVLQRWHERVEELLADVPHGSRGYHVLVACADSEASTQAALAERLLIDRSVMTYVLDDLEAADLVARRVDENDRRVRRVCVTEHGRAVLADLAARVGHVEQHVLAGLDDATRALFCAAARTAAVAIQETSPDLDPCAAVRTVVGDAPAARRAPRRRGRARS
ncbi:MarR family winged helix-turn-helix transcriptional regulator [Nocardiopsis protaetiae]|uniref:MarR family winged helix-turn-helix transcriptional regulator n=1 Tax=Nocardiopsis protaetiae TaxID=3382270 RepID=UPI00387B25BC